MSLADRVRGINRRFHFPERQVILVIRENLQSPVIVRIVWGLRDDDVFLGMEFFELGDQCANDVRIEIQRFRSSLPASKGIRRFGAPFPGKRSRALKPGGKSIAGRTGLLLIRVLSCRLFIHLV